MAQKCSKLFQNDPEGSKMFHNVPQGFSMFQKVLSKSPIIQKVLECPRALKKWKNSQLKLPATLVHILSKSQKSSTQFSLFF